MPREWKNLNVKQTTAIVVEDIIRLLNELDELTGPESELDAAIQKASESFEPFVELLGINFEDNYEDNYEDINLEALTSALPNLRTQQLLKQESVSPEPGPSRQVERRTRKSNLSSSSKKKHLNESSRESESSAEDQVVKPQKTSSGSHTMEIVENKDRLSRRKGSDAMNKSSEQHIATETSKEELRRHGSSSFDLNMPGPSGLHKRSDSKRTSAATSVYESFTHYSRIKLENDSDDEPEVSKDDSSTIY